MKKNGQGIVCDGNFTRKSFPKMKFLAVILLSWLTVSATGNTYFQQTKLTINLLNSSVKEVFEKIEENSEFILLYDEAIVDLDRKVSVKMENKTIEQILDQVFKGTENTYKIYDRQVVILKDKSAKAPSMLEIPVESTQEQGKKNVSGTVTDGAGEPITGAVVSIKGTSKGAITDIDGKYNIVVDDDNVILTFSFIGFQPQEQAVAGKTVLNVVLGEDVQALGEVVVTALNIERDKNSLGYSVTQVGANEINDAKENNPINSLAGKVSGLQITKSPTGVDGSSRVVLRGVSSITGNNRPLFVIDGIPMDAGYGGAGRWGGRDSGDALADLNPEDIESMSVLKGAGAAAAYGSRGANGVILITTKKGKNRKGIGISWSSGVSLETPMVTPDFQYDYTQGAFEQYPGLTGTPQRPANDHPWVWSYGEKINGQTKVNWLGEEEVMSKQANPYKEFLRLGNSFTNTVAFDGGNDKTNFRASLTNQDSKGIVPNNNLSRQTINLRGFSKLGEKIEFDSKITYIRSNVKNRPALAEDGANIIQTLAILPRNISLESLENNTINEKGEVNKWTVDNTFSNPYWVLDNIYNADKKDRFQGMFSMKWDVFKNFDLMLRSGLDNVSSKYESHENPGRSSDGNLGEGIMNSGASSSMEWNSDFLGSYSKKLDDFAFGLSVGGNYRYNEYSSISQSGSGMKVPGLYNVSNYQYFGTGAYQSKKKVYSIYGLGNLSYKNYLYLDVTARNDWSSTLPLKNNSYFYHSENLSFLFTEAFNLNLNWLNSGKLRASYAKVGNDTGPYQISKYYSILQTQTNYPLAGIGGQLPHLDLQPEETYSYEIGTNLVLLNNRLVFDFTYYNSISDNQIMNVDLAPSTGYATRKMNAGKIKNNGMEVQVNGTPVSTESGFSWDVILTWSKNYSEVIELYGDMEFLQLAEDFGVSIQARPDHPYGEIYTTDFKRDAFGNKLIDKDGYAQAGEYKAMGNINPDWIGGLSNQFSYKNWSLSFLIDMQMGGDIYSWGKAYMALFGTGAETLEGREEWIAGTGGYVESGISEVYGKPNTVAIDPSMRWYNLYNEEIGAEWIQDATNVRLRELVIGYKMPSKWFASTPINNISLSLVGRNLFFFYRAMDHFDPESGYSSGNVGNGLEHLSLPSTTSYGFNLKVNF
ncbi:MAG: SusC/RagA family TonB-linked outer membrane protein [Bacteroidales bacterium]